ncbi:MAG: PEFG-CTERM sorting domain-containing protein [Nitrosarchaeum sp.]
MRLSILTGMLLFLTVSLSLVGTSYAEPRTACIDCVQIPSYKLDLYKELFPLIVWTDSQVYNHNAIIKVNGYLKPQNNVAPILAVVTNPIGNVVTIQQISPDADGNFSFELSTASPLWTQNGDYVLKVQSGAETRQFKTKFTLVSSTLEPSDKCKSNAISVLANNDRVYCIPYQITSGQVASTKGKLNSDTKTMTLDMKGQSIESVVFTIPRSILDSKSSSGVDSVFVVTTNGKMVEYIELDGDSKTRRIQLDYPASGKASFEIIGTHIIPEFGSLALLVLVGSIVSILVISKSFSNRLVKF